MQTVYAPVQGNARAKKKNGNGVFPEELLRVPILSTCPVGGIVLDPFSGTGSTVDAAVRLGRKGIGIDLSNQYTEVAKRRLCETTKNFNDFSFYGR